MSLTADHVVELFEENVSARKRLAELLVTEPDVRLAIIYAILRDVATKGDINELRKEIKGEIDGLRKEIISLNNATKQGIDNLRISSKGDIESLRKEISGNFRWIMGVILTVWGATVIPILLKLIGAI